MDASAIREGLIAAGRSVVLVGMMGAGKSSVGRRVAARLGLPFLDADVEIEAAAGKTIAEIFERDGEPAFRQGERKVIQRLLSGAPCVLATGGGAFVDAETRASSRERAISVWLKADIETLLARTSRRNTRPLLNTGDPRETLTRLSAARESYYAEADRIVESRSGPVEGTVDQLLQELAACFDDSGALALGRSAA